mmetsp:Transcript_7477/g.16222  ORF Transcript_7477/g.16222 Transcript_7477/m.16222 type:complete len:412 (-) Transcript_7477:101-1336(-)
MLLPHDSVSRNILLFKLLLIAIVNGRLIASGVEARSTNLLQITFVGPTPPNSLSKYEKNALGGRAIKEEDPKLLRKGIRDAHVSISRGLSSDDQPCSHITYSSGNEDLNEIGKRSRISRRSMLATVVSAAVLLPSVSTPALPQAYPTELSLREGEDDLTKLRSDAISKAKSEQKETKERLKNSPFSITPRDLGGSLVWGTALWFLSGSRSNPLVAPLANLLYGDGENEDGKKVEEDWLKDRNLGLYSDLPPAFLLSIGVIFLWLGVALDRLALFVTEGDSGLCLELGGIAMIWGAFFEIGRIASGKKSVTREDYDRGEVLYNEFDEFANARLVCGNKSEGYFVHRSRVIGAFRRFNPKYRTAENDQYPLADIEIERLMRAWARRPENGSIEMSGAGYFQGVGIDEKSDIFK